MEENSLLISTAMKIILNAGNARTKADAALNLVNELHFQEAHQKILEARDDIKKHIRYKRKLSKMKQQDRIMNHVYYLIMLKIH